MYLNGEVDESNSKENYIALKVLLLEVNEKFTFRISTYFSAIRKLVNRNYLKHLDVDSGLSIS